MTPPSHALDVLVWGGGSGGVAAAIQAARGGARTVLLTPGAWLGGMVSAAGVRCPDGNELTPWQTGLWGVFLRELARREPEGLDHNWVSCFGYRPATAEAILREWVQREATLQWWPNCELLAIVRRGNRITAVEVRRGDGVQHLEPALLIDGSDSGDTYPLADVPHRLGWEAREQWGEPSAPAEADLQRDPFFQRQPVQSPTWVVMGQLVPDQPPLAPTGPDAASAAAPPAAPVRLPAPFGGATDAFGLERTISYGRLPTGLVMLNWPLHGNDWHDDLPTLFQPVSGPQPPIWEAMQQHSLRFAAALQEASAGRLRVAQCFPASAATMKDLQGPSPLALMPYWREGRRLVAQALVREQDLLPQGPGASIAAPSWAGDGQLQAIAVGNYANDHHYPGPDWPLAPKSCRWGGRWSGTPFTLPYGALVSAEVENLLAADKGTGVSHMANGATRLQPLILNTGQAAGAAAALCIQQGCRPAELPVRLLQHTLIHDALAPSAVVPLWDTPWHHPAWAERQQAVLDDPARLGADGSLTDRPFGSPEAAMALVPAEPGEKLWKGLLRPDGQGGFSLELADGSGIWPVITIEPSLHHWLNALERPRQVALIGCANPWGPWLRLSRLS